VLKLFLDPIIDLARGLLRFLPNLAFLVVIFLASRYLLKLIRLLFTGLHHESIVIKGFYPEWAMPTFRLLRILVIVFAIVVAYPHIPGSGSSAFKGLSVFLGLLLSIGSSSFISNVIAGYSLTYRRAFKLGDRIKVNENDGFVEEQKLLVTRLRSIKNEEIVIPNSMMINSSILNYSAVAGPSGVVMHTVVGIGYETPWRQVDAMLRLAADRTEGLMKDPPPYVLKLSLGDFAVNYELNVYCHNVSQLHFYYNDLHQNILDVFNENHVQIMTPAYMSDPAVPKIVPEDKRYSQVSGDGGKSTGKG
jgi:small-conductance mechanosensitive channel